MFNVILREDDLKEVETYQSISGSYVCILIIFHLLALAIKFFIDTWL